MALEGGLTARDLLALALAGAGELPTGSLGTSGLSLLAEELRTRRRGMCGPLDSAAPPSDPRDNDEPPAGVPGAGHVP